MRTRVHVRLVTTGAVVLILLGWALVTLPLAAPAPDPVRIESVHVDGRGAHFAIRVLREGRLVVEVRTAPGRLVRVLVPDRAVRPGDLNVAWNGSTDSAFGAGVYVVRVTACPGLRCFVVERRLPRQA